MKYVVVRVLFLIVSGCMVMPPEIFPPPGFLRDPAVKSNQSNVHLLAEIVCPAGCGWELKHVIVT